MSTSMPPPPTTTDTPVAGAGSGSGGDKLKQFLVNLTGGGMPMVQKQLEDAHAKRVADAQLYHKNYSDLSALLAGDKEGKYVDKQGNLTPEGQKIEQQRQTAFQTWQKTAGVTKEGKGVIAKLGQITDKLVHHRKDAGGQGQPQAQPSGPTSPAMPPPPGYSPPGQDPATMLANQQHAAGQADLDAASKRKIAEEEAAAKAKAQYARPRHHAVMVTDPNDPTRQVPAVQDLDTFEVTGPDGNPIANPGKLLPAMLPTQNSTTSTYNADTGTTVTSHSSRKIAPGGPTAAQPTKLSPPSGHSAASSPKPGGRLAAMADDWEQNGIVPSAKDKPQVEQYLKSQGRSTPVNLIPAAQKTIEDTAPVMDQINGLLKDIDDLKLGDNNTSGYLLASRAAYALGKASPEGSLGKDIAGLSLGSVVEAASTLKGASRSVLALKKALEHTPNPWVDSPKLMKEKLKTIQARLKDVMDDAYKYGKKGAVPNPSSAMPAPPQSADAEAAAYLAKHGAH